MTGGTTGEDTVRFRGRAFKSENWPARRHPISTPPRPVLKVTRVESLRPTASRGVDGEPRRLDSPLTHSEPHVNERGMLVMHPDAVAHWWSTLAASILDQSVIPARPFPAFVASVEGSGGRLVVPIFLSCIFLFVVFAATRDSVQKEVGQKNERQGMVESRHFPLEKQRCRSRSGQSVSSRNRNEHIRLFV